MYSYTVRNLPFSYSATWNSMELFLGIRACILSMFSPFTFLFSPCLVVFVFFMFRAFLLFLFLFSVYFP